MDPNQSANPRWHCERGEVASWLILAAGLALAATLAAGVIGDVVGVLTSNVAEAAGVQAGDGASGGAAEENGSGNPTPIEHQGGAGSGSDGGSAEENTSGNPTPIEHQGGAGSGEGADDPGPLPDWCYEGWSRSCDAEGNCLSFEPLACSNSPTARDNYDMASWYDHCSSGPRPIFLCSSVTPFEPAFRTVLESELGAHPGDLYMAAAIACDAGHLSCALWTQLADFVFDHREVLATATVLGDIIPGPRGVSCIPSFIDGEISVGEATECAIGIGTGLSVPFPSGVVDDAVSGD